MIILKEQQPREALMEVIRLRILYSLPLENVKISMMTMMCQSAELILASQNS